jgi:putative membrane protein
MLQHELLMMVAAPLLVLGRPLAAWTWALRPDWRRRMAGVIRWRWLAFAWSALTRPVCAWALHAVALWAWHIPPFFEAALHNEGLHILQHASFFVTALLFWWAVLGSDARSKTSAFAMVYLFTTMMHTSALGALLSLAPTPWYAPYVPLTAALGLDPVDDQQLGGLIMWVPAALAYVVAALAVIGRMLGRARA